MVSFHLCLNFVSWNMVSKQNQSEKAFKDFRQGLMEEVKGTGFGNMVN